MGHVHMVKSQDELLTRLGCESCEQAKRGLYKSTSCGAWIEFENDSIVLGSIVEGADFGTTKYRLPYPFPIELYERVVEAIEAEADAVWTWANETDQEADAPDIALDYRDLEPYRDGQSA